MARPFRSIGAILLALAPFATLAASAADPDTPTAARAARPATSERAPAPKATPVPNTTPAREAVTAGRAMSPRERAQASPVPIWIRNGLLVEQGGRALYVFDHDLPDESQCDIRCMALWPPHYAAPDAKPHGPFTVARATDGRPMWAYQGKPLYRWVSDRKRGAAGGDGVSRVWFLARVPAAIAPQVVPYFPMPMPRPGAAPRPSPTATKESVR